MTMKCHGCGATLDEGRYGSGVPCPKCGSVERDIAVSVNEKVVVGDHGAMQQKRDGETIGFAESSRQGLGSHAFTDDAGELRYGLSGRPPQGEQDTLPVCAILIRHLNDQGADWEPPVGGERDVDCLAESASNHNDRLQVQVVRAASDQTLWRDLGSTGEIEVAGASPEGLARELKAAIEHKAEHQIPPAQRVELTLALDANRLPAHALSPTVQAFREAYGVWAAGLGFQSVWLVGPAASLTSRLDVAS